MKHFLTSMLGALVALLIFTFGGFLLFAGIVGAIVSMSANKAASTEKVQPGSYLVIDFSANIDDAPPAFELGSLAGDRAETLQLRSVTRALKVAAKDSRIAGVLLKGSFSPEGLGSGFAALREVRAALAEFRASHKPVEAYLESADTRSYYVASVANEIVIDPYGMILMPGLATEPMFYAGAMEKYGVGVQVTRVGKYKSFVEPFTRKEMSPENREETQRLLDDLWGSLLSDVGRARKLTPEQIQRTVDSEGLIRPEAALKAGLVDKIAYRDEVIDEIKKAGGQQDAKGTFRQVSIAAYAAASADPARNLGGKAVAVVYAEGDIVDGEGGIGDIGGVSFAREIRSLRENDNVKAIVLRVNSPGGSATAAEEIQREIRLARKVKPVIVSMGSYAASGGYWISAYADRIFAEPTTITGSIGVFGMQFDVKRLANDFGITFDGVKTGRFADSMTITRPKTPAELAVLQNLVDWIYGQFVDKVAEGRKLDKARVEEIAQGRVWSGSEALKLGLVDEMGGLSRAIGYALEQAKITGPFRLLEYPRKKTLAEEIQAVVGRIAPEMSQAPTGGIVSRVQQRLERELASLKAFNDPQGVYARLPVDLLIR